MNESQLEKAGKHLDQAYTSWEANDFESALRECELAIQIAPDLAQAHNLRGVILEDQGRREEAIAAYREAVRLDPNLRDAKQNLSGAESAAKLTEKTSKHHLDRAYALEEKNDLVNALRECEVAIQLAPDLAEAHNLRGIILDELGYAADAITAYREAVRLDPDFAEARENLIEAQDERREKPEMTLPAPQNNASDESTEKPETVPSPRQPRAEQVIDYHLSIDTPENVVFDYSVSGIGSRFLAALVDTLIILLLQIVVLLASVLLISPLINLESWDSDMPVWIFAIFGLISFALLWGYYIFFEVLWNGQSPGKRWVGLRVIRTDGTPITFTESVIRNLVRLVDFMPAYYGVGVVTMFINAQSRRLGDLAAGTLVVYDHPTVTLESLQTKPKWSERPQPSATTDLNLPIERLTDRDIQMAEDFLNRQQEFAKSPSTRAAVAHRIAQALLRRMEVGAEQMGMKTAEELILAVVQLYRSQEE
ncbi:MAG: RDD family protein [Anaerolineae bacterium]